MTQVAILSGIYTDAVADFRVSMPKNLVPVPGQNGIAAGYLRVGEGLTRLDDGSAGLTGVGRGGINWNGVLYRVIGDTLVRVQENGAVLFVGNVGDNGKPVSMDYSFDRLAIASNNRLYYYDGSNFTRVTDPDLGVVLDVVWMDGYFVTTDGTSLVVTELNDPTQVDPLKYGSSEADPDPVVALLKTRSELYALNRYTIEVFDNVGGNLFPFTRNPGAMIQKGCVGTQACCLVAQVFAFLGGGRNEQCSVYLGASGQATKIATREVEDIIAKYTEEQLSAAVVEARLHRIHQHIYVHLPGETLVYDVTATAELGTPVWFSLYSDIEFTTPFRARNYVFCYDKWMCDDIYDSRIGLLDRSVETQYGEDVGWQFETTTIYNGGFGVITHALELVGLPGTAKLGQDPQLFVSWTEDGQTWSDQRALSQGKQGERNKRMQIRRLGRFRNWRGYRFRAANSTIATVTRLEAQLEALTV